MADLYVLNESLKEADEPSPVTGRYSVRYPDSNQGSYQSSQISWNIPAVSSEGGLLDMKTCSVELPIVMSLSSDQTLGTALESAFSMGLKSSFLSLVNSIDLSIDNQPLLTRSDLSNIPLTFKILSSFSQDDVKTLANTINFGLDDPKGLGYLITNHTCGEVNNVIQPVSFDPDNGYEQGLVNSGLRTRMKKTSYDVTATEEAKFADLAGVIAKRKSHYTRAATLLTYNVLVNIPLSFLSIDLFSNIPLSKGLYIKMNLGIHTGSVALTTTITNGYVTAVTPSTQYGVLPFQIAPNKAGLFTVDTGANAITARINIAKTVESATTPFGATCYFIASFVKLKPAIEQSYLSQNSAKLVRYCEAQMYKNPNNILAGGSIQHMVSTGLSKIRGLLISTHLASSINGSSTATATSFSAGNSAGAFSVMNSPFSSAPATCMKNASITQFNVRLGGVPVYPQNQDYTYEMFAENKMVNSLNGGLMTGLTSGLIDIEDFESGYGYIYVDLSRYSANEQMDNTPRNIEIIGRNNSINMVEQYIFVLTEREFTLNCATGKISM